ncbi:MAG TPA: PilZ domain-containing protein [Candidatus Acidoferrum sp.]|nr:PilZ domain-containing protein [Candidatus Dormibacteraeota bacterium]HXN51891.1 PilZ domain-containing protein [Candidatus Acidoferrum sp.]
MPEGADRREARRFLMSLPMRVLLREAHNKELLANTRDVSYRGLYFLSETKFEVGSPIEFVLTLPQKVPSSGEVDIHCRGQVVRVEAGVNGRVGVAAKIERYEFLPASATAA